MKKLSEEFKALEEECRHGVEIAERNGHFTRASILSGKAAAYAECRRRAEMREKVSLPLLDGHKTHECLGYLVAGDKLGMHIEGCIEKDFRLVMAPGWTVDESGKIKLQEISIVGFEP